MSRVLPLVFAVAIVATTSAQQPLVRVYVTSKGAVHGMTDPSKDNQDTVKDLIGSLKDHKKDLTVVASPDDAQIVLTVQGRETAQMTAGFMGPARDRIIRVSFKAGDLETEMTASAQGGTLASGGSWGKAAGKIAKQVDEWIKANGKLLADAPATAAR